jgi:mannose-6-phosphate isomerase-like protein (cupin superfamily)
MSLAYLAADHQKIEWLGGSTMELLLDSDATEGQLFMARTRLVAGDASPVHMHTNEDEIFLLLDGSATFWFGEECSTSNAVVSSTFLATSRTPIASPVMPTC